MDPKDRVAEAEKQIRLARDDLEATGDPLDLTDGELLSAWHRLDDTLRAMDAEEDGVGKDVDAAVEIATARLAEQFRSRMESGTSDLAILTDHTDSIKAALEDGDAPAPEDIEQAYHFLLVVKDDLLDAARLFGMDPWSLGVNYGDLSPEEQAEIEERAADD